MLNFKYNIFFNSCILISLNVVITKDQLSGDNKTNLVFMMKPIITRETERREQRESTRQGVLIIFVVTFVIACHSYY